MSFFAPQSNAHVSYLSTATVSPAKCRLYDKFVVPGKTINEGTILILSMISAACDIKIGSLTENCVPIRVTQLIHRNNFLTRA